MISKEDKIFLSFGAIIIILCLSFYLIAYFPGSMSTDSVSQWSQMITFKFTNWHPVISTLFYYLCTRIWYSPASVAIAQILILTAVFLSGIYMLLKMKVNKVILAITIIFFSLYPTNGFLVIALWKDIIYSIMLLWATIILLEILHSQGEWIKSRSHKLIFTVNSLGILFFRHNGILTFVFVVAALVIIYREYFKAYFILTTVILLVYFIVSGPGFKLLKVVNEPSVEVLGIPMQQVAAVIKYNGNISEGQKEFFSRILPLELWKSEYNPYSTNPIKFHSKFDVTYASEHKIEFIKNWLSLVKNNPVITAKAYLKHTSMIWKVTPLQDSYTYTVTAGITTNNLGLKNYLISPEINKFANRVLSFTQESGKMILFWRPALWLYVSIIAAIIIAKYKGFQYLILLIPMLSNALAFMIATPAQDYRYQYANFLIAAILVPLAVQLIASRKHFVEN